MLGVVLVVVVLVVIVVVVIVLLQVPDTLVPSVTGSTSEYALHPSQASPPLLGFTHILPVILEGTVSNS